MTMLSTNLAARSTRVQRMQAASDRLHPQEAAHNDLGSLPRQGRRQADPRVHLLVRRWIVPVLTAVMLAFTLTARAEGTQALAITAKKDKGAKTEHNAVKQLTAEEMTFVEDTIFRATNIVRKRKGLKPLTSSHALAYVARHHSRDMCQTGTFKHESEAFPKGWKRFTERMELVSLSDGGENIAFQTFFKDRKKWALSIIKGWMGSPPHRKNILDPAFRYMGVGIGQCGKNIGYVTQVFSTQPGDTPVLRHHRPRQGRRAHLHGNVDDMTAACIQ